jgi:hypothetical protein
VPAVEVDDTMPSSLKKSIVNPDASGIGKHNNKVTLIREIKRWALRSRIMPKRYTADTPLTTRYLLR